MNLMDEKYKDKIEKENSSDIFDRESKTAVMLNNGYLRIRMPKLSTVNSNFTVVGWLTQNSNDCLSIDIVQSLKSEKIETFCKDSLANLITIYINLVFSERFVKTYDVSSVNANPREVEIKEQNFSLILNGTSVISGLKIYNSCLTSSELFRNYAFNKPG